MALCEKCKQEIKPKERFIAKTQAQVDAENAKTHVAKPALKGKAAAAPVKEPKSDDVDAAIAKAEAKAKKAPKKTTKKKATKKK